MPFSAAEKTVQEGNGTEDDALVIFREPAYYSPLWAVAASSHARSLV